MNHRERISGVDTAWLRMEHPTNPMMIVGVMMLEGRLRAKELERVLERRFLAYRRFRQRAVHEGGAAWWETDDALDLSVHVRTARLPGKAGKRELEKLVSRLASTPLDFSRPLWQFDLVDNYAGGSALIVRIHHCYADGIALIRVMLSLTDATAEGSRALPAADVEAAAPPALDVWAQVLAPFAGALGGVAELGRKAAAQGRDAVSDPKAAAGALQDAARNAVEFAGEAARLALMGPDTPTRFKGALSARKRVAWADPLPLAEVKAVGKALGCSINDVLLSMATGALRDYLADRGDPVAGIAIRAIVPVNLRGEERAIGLGNHFGLVFLELPIGIDHPLERLYEVRSRMRALKGSYQPLIALGLLSAVGYGPRAIQEQVAAMLGSCASAVMTNVPGPAHALYLAGERITELDFWVPQSGGIGMGVSILSYDGRIQFGVITDAGLVPDPQRIVARFADEFEKLMWLTLMSPWGEEAADAVVAAAEVPPVPKRFRNL